MLSLSTPLCVAAAQTPSVPGDLQRNLQTHLACVRAAAHQGVQLLQFPELSLIGYEPALMADHVLTADHPVLAALRQAAQAAVAEACIRLLLINGVDLDIGVSQNLLGNFVQAQVEQAGAQAAAHQELHAEVVDLLLALAQDLGLELLLAVRHDLTNDHCHAAVDLLGGSNVQRDAAFADDLVFENFFKFFFSKFHQKYPSPYGLSIPEPSGIILNQNPLGLY